MPPGFLELAFLLLATTWQLPQESGSTPEDTHFCQARSSTKAISKTP
jgi:hypothetical protein